MPDLVLDTNVVLDWLVFRDPAATWLGDALDGGPVRWVRTPGMRDELLYVLQRLPLARWGATVERVAATCDAVAVAVDGAPPLPPGHGLRCGDPDDQPFIDLAVLRGAAALLTRDKAVLRLARPALRHGVTIATPQAWLRTLARDA